MLNSTCVENVCVRTQISVLDWIGLMKLDHLSQEVIRSRCGSLFTAFGVRINDCAIGHNIWFNVRVTLFVQLVHLR